MHVWLILLLHCTIPFRFYYVSYPRWATYSVVLDCFNYPQHVSYLLQTGLYFIAAVSFSLQLKSRVRVFCLLLFHLITPASLVSLSHQTFLLSGCMEFWGIRGLQSTRADIACQVLDNVGDSTISSFLSRYRCGLQFSSMLVWVLGLWAPFSPIFDT